MRREPRRIGNTVSDGLTLKLHGNTIAEWRDGSLWVTTAGWNTSTTKDRLNGLAGVRVHQNNWDFYLNGQKWGGEWTQI